MYFDDQDAEMRPRSSTSQLARPRWTLLIGLILSLGLHPGGLTAQTDKPEKLTHHEADDRDPAYSPDGRKVVFESNRDGNWELYLLDLKSSKIQRLTDNSASDRQAAWSPNGQELVFQRSRRGKGTHLYRMSIKDREAEPIRTYPGEVSNPHWSPDGKWIAFTSDRDGQPEVYIIQLESGRELRITEGEHRSIAPRWSPDGRRLLYFSRSASAGRHDDISMAFLAEDPVTVLALQGQPRSLTQTKGHEFVPAWSPDGKRWVHARSHGEVRDLQVLDLPAPSSTGTDDQAETTSSLVTLAPGFDRINGPDWSSDGEHIVFSARLKGESYDIYQIAAP